MLAGWLLLHYLLLILLAVFGLHRLQQSWRLWRLRHQAWPQAEPLQVLPSVTVQLPIYNERCVVERLIDAACALDYPAAALRIQVLDDSTDETQALAAARVRYWQNRGVAIEHVRRSDRRDFKAGALAVGLARSDSECLAIFDADFVPSPDLLRRAMPFFADPRMGMVQLRWAHLNRGRNWLTRIQAVLLDAHFAVEQRVRSLGGFRFNFNGTAGIWRRRAIVEAGGWQGDTLTEDMDLSYRAQLAGWRFAYLGQISCPGELPDTINGFKRQQHRWAKGAIQVLLKLAPRILASPWPWRIKLEAFFHMGGNLAYLLMVLDTVFFLAPAIWLRAQPGQGWPWWWDLGLYALTGVSHLVFFLMGQRELHGRLWPSLRLAPALLLVGVGLAVNNARAVLEAIFGHRSEFVRTPKRGDAPRHGLYPTGASGAEWLEIALGLFYGGVLLWLAAMGLWWALPFMLLLHAGFLGSGLLGLLERRPRLRPA